MAFPTVETTNTSYEAAATTTHTVNLPASISSGDLLLVFMAIDAGGAPFTSFPAGWTEIKDVTESLGYITLAVAYRVADGEEGATIDVDTTPSNKSAHASYRISGHDSANAPEISTGASGTGTNPDPDSLSPTGGSDDYLWVALVVVDGKSDTGPWEVTAAPSNYTDLINSESQSATFGATIGVARRELTGSSEDPGVFTIESGAEHFSATLAVYPSSGLSIAIVPTDSTYDIAKPVIVG